MGLGSVPKLADGCVTRERCMHDRALNAYAATVNETDLFEARFRCGFDVFFNDRLDVAGGKAV